MPRVILQPSFGSRAAREDWKRTLDSEVEFSAPPYAPVISPPDLQRLTDLHPTGRARFWGATSKQDGNYTKMSTGDVVLFTGQNQVRAIGEIGVILRNAAFADLMWSPDPGNGSWLNIYSVQAFDRVQISYGEIRALEGFSLIYPFRRLHVLDSDRSNTVLAALRINVHAPAGPDAEEARRLALLAQNTGKVAAAEAFATATTSYQQPARTIYVNRAESQLITAYRDNQPGDQNITLQAPTGRADYYAKSPEGGVIIEAKSSARHPYVRQALSQLLDYVRFASPPASRLGALFPQCPSEASLQLLHRYGIDCIYLDPQGRFASLPAPEDARAVWQ